MIRSVRGRLVALEPDAVVVEVGGVGLGLRVSATTARQLPRVGEQASLQTHLVVREDALDLYGFAERAERELFEAFLGVGGVGPRIALAICGLDAPDALRLALARGDAATIQRASGVGKRTAERVVLELRERMAVTATVTATNGGAPQVSDADAFLAARDGLLALGFRPDEVDAAMADAPGGGDPEAMLRHALERLRRK
jgi:Holliday junction DNA helicase RuvA